ncbi:unnamed protein product [Rhodiola kirilowii]
MADGCPGIRVEDGVDRISELPVHLREHILESMSIKDAVSTSSLSSKWRYCWTGLRTLNFGYHFWDFDKHNPYMMLDLLERTRAVERVLMVHCGPIREFILYVSKIQHKTVDINLWLRALSNNGVQKIKISSSICSEGLFSIPSGLFNCRELEELSLRDCKFTLPRDYKGFANLTTLGLDGVNIAPSLLESLISGCLLLETLTLKELMLNGPFALETLNLKTFYFTDHDLEFIIFKDNPKLTCVSLFWTCESEFDRMDTSHSYNSTLKHLRSLSMIKELAYDFWLLDPLRENCPSSTLIPLENLKCLTLRAVDLRLPEDILFTLCLLRSAPNLQNLTIELESESERVSEIKKVQEEAAKLLEFEVKKHTSYDTLQTIKINRNDGLPVPHENLLIKLLQTRCPKVKSIIIGKMQLF